MFRNLGMERSAANPENLLMMPAVNVFVARKLYRPGHRILFAADAVEIGDQSGTEGHTMNIMILLQEFSF